MEQANALEFCSIALFVCLFPFNFVVDVSELKLSVAVVVCLAVHHPKTVSCNREI